MARWTVGIETVATAGSVALFCDDELHAEHALPAASRSAKTLAAGVQQLWHRAGNPAVALVAVAKGPGSFTGLRVGVTTAKALAYAWRAKLIGVNTLDAIATQVLLPESVSPRNLQVVLDAQRQELFVATFRALENSGWQRLEEDQIVPAPHWLANLPAGEIVTGPALKKLREKLPPDVIVAPEVDWHPRAATVARLGYERDLGGQPDELWTLLPHYLRVSYAEESKVKRSE